MHITFPVTLRIKYEDVALVVKHRNKPNTEHFNFFERIRYVCTVVVISIFHLAVNYRD